MNKFRASFSLLTKWESGDFEGFVKGYFKLEKPITTREMSEGKEYHQQWQKEIEDTKCMPKLLGGKKLNNPICEIKKVVQLEDWLEYVFIADMVDGEDIHEFKTGVSKSSDHINSKQLGCYAVGLTMDKQVVKRGFLHHYDQYSKKYDMSMIWITDEVIKEAHNWILTLSAEAHDYLLSNGLYERFGNSK